MQTMTGHLASIRRLLEEQRKKAARHVWKSVKGISDAEDKYLAAIMQALPLPTDAELEKVLEPLIQAAEYATEADCLKVVQKAYYNAYAKSDRLNMRVCAEIEKYMKESKGQHHLERAVLEARIEEAKWWQENDHDPIYLRDPNHSCPGCRRIAALEQALAKLNETAGESEEK
jgi:hypothetical protein